MGRSSQYLISALFGLVTLSGCGDGQAPSTTGAAQPLSGAVLSQGLKPTPLLGVGLNSDPAAASEAPAFTASDVLAALKMATGRNPNADPDGPGPLQAASQSQEQLSAVDLNIDGRVTQDEAVQILAMAASGSPATLPTAPTITTASAGDQRISVAFSVPSFSGGRAVSSYTATCTAGSVSSSVSGAASPLVVTGLTSGLNYACTVLGTNVVGNGPPSAAVTATPLLPAATSFAPQKFSSIINLGYSAGSLTTLTAFTSRKRFLIGDTTAAPLLWATGTQGVNMYPLLGSAVSGETTYKDWLSRTLHAVVDSTDSSCFRLDAHLNSNYSIDVDASAANKLVFRNNWGLGGSTGHGYLCFGYESATKLLKANKRYTYNSSTYAHTLDSSFAPRYVKYANGEASLVDSLGQATQLALFGSPINFDMPADLNPSNITASSNSSIPFQSSLQKITSTSLSSFVTRPDAATFRNQISVNNTTPTVGYNSTTVAQQDAMLATIESTARSNGFTLRYPVSTYKVFRDAALRYTLFGNSVVDGTAGENTVPLIYFINPKDASGAYHPAMIVVAYSVPESPHYLRDVVRPPGGGDTSITVCNQGVGGTGYGNQCVTRSTVRQNFFFRVPLRDYGLTTGLCDNTMSASLFSDYKKVAATTCNTQTTVENYASIADNGVMIDGTSIYPVLNNILITAQEESSLNMHGCHVGQGFGYHCHADGFSAMGNGLSLYNLRDYAGQSHPPLLGFGFDGIALYGRYLSSHPDMVGYTASATLPTSTAAVTGVELDAYGGHTHLIDGVSSYHQHSRPYSAKTLSNGSVSGGTSYTVHSLITGAWRGRINEIPNFWDGTKPNTRGVFPLLTN